MTRKRFIKLRVGEDVLGNINTMKRPFDMDLSIKIK